jgi:uncharacterized membrane protein
MQFNLKKFIQKFFSYFLQGILYIAPLGATIFVIVVTFRFVDDTTSSVIKAIFHRSIPGLGIVMMVIFITLIGIFGKSIIARPLSAMVHSILDKTPFVKIIYTSIKDLLSAFVGQKKKFTEPVLVKMYNDSNVSKLGFITQKDLSSLGIPKGMIAVYLPHSYNFSGNLFIVPSENVTPINASSTEVMKFIVSGGITEIND